METRNSRSSGVRGALLRRLAFSRFAFRFSFFAILISIAAVMFAAGCGAPGEPTAPSPTIPVAITDLAAAQSGDGVQLTFTLPTKTTTGERLADAPAIEILRGAAKPNGSPDAKSFRVVYTIPSALVINYRSEDHVQFVDPVPPEEARASAGGMLLYRVRTRASRKRTSADSNTVTLRMLPVAERVASLQTKLTEDAVELTWSAPTYTSSGEPLAALSEYHVYRGEIDPASARVAAVAAVASPPADLSQARWKSPLAFLGSSASTTYRDTAFEFDKTYAYTVRAITQPEGHALESSDSTPAVVTPRDIFPPATPTDVRASVIVGNPTDALKNPDEVDLSWSINSEPDLAGYRVYRSEQQDTAGELVTPDLLLSPAYRDTSVQPGHRYWYRVTSVDRSGNESAPCEPVAADLTQPSR
jgi:hypothetical protein